MRDTEFEKLIKTKAPIHVVTAAIFFENGDTLPLPESDLYEGETSLYIKNGEQVLSYEKSQVSNIIGERVYF